MAYGSGDDDPSTWQPILRVSFTEDNTAVYEFYPLTAALQKQKRPAYLVLLSLFSSDYQGTRVLYLPPGADPIFGYEPHYEGQLRAKISRSSSNWYGDWHWRSKKGYSRE